MQYQISVNSKNTKNGNQLYDTPKYKNTIIQNLSNPKTLCPYNKISILHQNIQHLPSRIDSLNLTLEELKPVFVALSEHKMSKYEIDRVNVDGYRLCTFFARENPGGGGVMILLKRDSKIHETVIPQCQTLVQERVFEYCALKFKIDQKYITLVCFYRSPIKCNQQIFLDKLEVLLNCLVKNNNKIIIVGDFNVNVLNKDLFYVNFVNVLAAFNVRYLVDFPTRVTTTTATAIDNCISNIPNLIISGLITELSDHDAQLVELLLDGVSNTLGTCKQMIRKFNKVNKDTFCRQIASETWLEVYQATVDVKYDIFLNTVLYYFDVYFPKMLSKVTCQKSLQWVSQDIMDGKHEILQLSRLFRETKGEGIKRSLRRKKREIRNKVNEAKKQFYDSKVANADNCVKVTWGIINNEVGKQQQNLPNFKINLNSEAISDPIRIAESFNNFFINIVKETVHPRSENTNYSNVFANNTECLNGTNFAPIHFKFTTVTDIEVLNVIKSLKNKTSSGFDEIPISLIKEFKDIILKPLTHLINSSLISGIFPSKLKIAKVIPILKKGKSEELGSYRPISLLPTFSKIYEKIVHKQLVLYLEGNGLLDDQQHGFRSGRSTVTAGVRFVQTIIDAIDNKENVVGLFLDISKAFDSILHDRLFSILYNFGIRGKELQWFKSYVQDRYQFVEIKHQNLNVIESHKSTMSKIMYGVPQGSILGPLLFICYLTGLPSLNIDNSINIVLYADDANVIFTGKSQQDIENKCAIEMTQIKQFLNSANLLLNTNKTNFISFHTKQNRHPIHPLIKIEDYSVEQLTDTKFLGLIIDNNLSWDEHVKFVSKKLSSGLYALRRMKHYCNLTTLKTIYFSLLQSHISYGIAIYGGTTKKNLDYVLKLQKKAIKVMLDLAGNDSVKFYFKELGFLTVYDLYILETIKYCKQYNISNTQTQTHTHNTRYHFTADRHNLELYKKKTTYAGLKFLQHLPQDIANEQNHRIFISKLKSFLMNISCYSIEEFYNFRAQ